jgi:hypothetical protein
MRAVVDCSVRVAVPVVDRGAGGGPACDQCRLAGQRAAAQGREMFACTTMGLLSSLMAVVRPTSTPWRVADRTLSASRSPGLRELDVVVPAGRGPAGADRVEPIVRRAAGASEGADFDDVLTGRASSTTPAGKLPVPSKRPDPVSTSVNLDPLSWIENSPLSLVFGAFGLVRGHPGEGVCVCFSCGRARR